MIKWRNASVGLMLGAVVYVLTVSTACRAEETNVASSQDVKLASMKQPQPTQGKTPKKRQKKHWPRTMPSVSKSPLMKQPALSKNDQSNLKLAKRLGMPGASVEESCLESVGSDCAKWALDDFSRALLDTRAGKKHTRVTVFGNSLIASDHIVDIVREAFVTEFGDGGRGFLLADRMADYGRRTRTGITKRGFTTYNFGQGEIGPYPHGLPGVLHETTKKASTRWIIDGADMARVFWFDHKRAPQFTLWVDKEKMTDVVPQKQAGGRIETIRIPDQSKNLIFKTNGRRAVLYGASLEREKPGFILDTFGVVASDAKRFLKTDPDLHRQQLTALDPDLIVFMLGGNEIKRVAWGRYRLDAVRNDLRKLIRRTKEISPRSSCLVVGPLENVRGTKHKRPFQTRPQVRLVNAAKRAVALEEGCAFFDLFKAMGSSGAMQRLSKRNLLHDDLVHPKGRGLDIPGSLMVDALFKAIAKPVVNNDELRQKWSDASGAVLMPPSLEPPLRWFDQIRRVTTPNRSEPEEKVHSRIAFMSQGPESGAEFMTSFQRHYGRVLEMNRQTKPSKAKGKPTLVQNHHWESQTAFVSPAFEQKVAQSDPDMRVYWMPPEAPRLETRTGCLVVSMDDRLKKDAAKEGCLFFDITGALGQPGDLQNAQILEASQKKLTAKGQALIAQMVWADMLNHVQQHERAAQP